MTKVTGELISIDDSAYDGFKGMTIYGKTVQNLWVNPNGANNGITATANADGSITFSGTPNVQGSSPTISSGKIYTLKPNTTYIAFSDKAIADEYDLNHGACLYVSLYQADGTYITDKIFAFTGNLSVSFTTDSRLGYAICRITVRPNTTVSGTYRVMLNEGSEAEPWCPPGLNSVGELSVVCAGKNLFTPNSKTQIQGNGGSNQTTRIGTKVSGIPVQQAVAVSLEYRLSSGVGTMAVQQDGQPYKALGISYLALIGDGQWHKASGNVTVNDGFNKNDRISIRLDNVTGLLEFRNIQFELGSTATAYEPPAVTTTPIDLQGHTLNALPDGTRDELHIDGGGNVVLEKRCGVATAPTEASRWMWDSSGSRGYFALPAISRNKGTWDQSRELLCDKLSPAMSVGDVSNAVTVGGFGYAKNPAITSTATAATVAGGAICLYQLEAPQTIQLGKISLPKLRKKPLVNNVWTNGTAEGTGFSLAPEIDYEYRRWRMGCDGVSADGQHSFWDLGGCIAARDTGVPEKKPVTATVPYMSGFYDLSDLYGAVAYDSREVMYRFEFVEDSREDLQDIKSRFLKWLANVQNAEIVDDDIPGRHLIGSFSEAEFEEGEEGESGSLEVTFLCQPFFEADEETVKTLSAGSNTVTIEGQAVNAYAKSAGTSTLKIGGVNQSVGTTEIRLSQQLKPGDNAVTVTGSAVTLRWRENTI